MATPVNSEKPWSLQGKSALVSAASRGIGKAIAIYFARKGLANIAITYASNKAAAEDTLAQVRALGVRNAIALRADATDGAAWPGVVADALAGLGVPAIDILVNNAIQGDIGRYLPLAETGVEAFTEAMVANVYSPVATTLAYLERAAPRGGGGRVINISSVAGEIANEDPVVTYGASKAALQSFTRSFAGSFASERGVTFNSVVVGPTATDAIQQAFETYGDEFKRKHTAEVSAAPRIGEVEDIAYIVGFLASEEGRWVNGAAVSANGGYRSTLAALG
ncbi:Short chain dehydrogenase asqE [Colletotrichum trifolii]|uniref:Short chain dehydrogenase asqE n=1 Tax=Colletotrichum trifolii TaxID=5466 RepID=A0A4R8QXN0_COLTR|nr:Short chain dehydrogenase asqE [Colletotrichum trifolii]